MRAAAERALEERGFGMSSVRFICGTQDLHKRLEAQLAQFLRMDDTILYSSCFDANAGFLDALGLDDRDMILSDTLNHASIIDGVRLVKKPVKTTFKHMDLDDLRAKLSSDAARRLRHKFVLTDGAFSMDGDIAPVEGLYQVAREHGAWLLVDDSHASGVVGESGRGSLEPVGLLGAPGIIVTSTLGKALGGAAGGFTAGPAMMVELLRQKSRPSLFSNSIPPHVAAGSSRAVELLQESPHLLQTLRSNTERFRSQMTAAGFQITGADHPICPVMLGDAALATQMADMLLDRGIYVIGFSFPVVPVNQARIRVQLSAEHTPEQVDQTVKAFVEVGHSLGVIPSVPT